MSAGLDETFRFLARTENEAAVDILVAALDSPCEAIQDRALRSLLVRPSPRGHAELFRRLPSLDARCRSVISERPERLVRAVRDALGASDEGSCTAALRAVVSLRLYDTIPALLALLKNRDSPKGELAAQTVLELAELFYRDLADTEAKSKQGNLASLRRRITFALEEAVAGFATHQRIEVIEAFLLLAKRQNVLLQRVLQEPREAGRDVFLDVLSSSSRGGVIRLLLSFLEAPQMPRAVKEILTGRTDSKLVENLVRQLRCKPSKAMIAALESLGPFAWARPEHPVLAALDGSAQRDAVQLLTITSMHPDELIDVLGFLLLKGKPEGRQAAARQLAEFDAPKVDDLIAQAVGDDDPGVQAELIRQLRSRQLPGAMSLLFGKLDSPHEEVRRALREALPEFTVEQFLVNCTSMPAELLATAGYLVRKVDIDAKRKLSGQMECPSPVRRRRAVVAAGAMGLASELEESIIRLLSDEDHMVRAEAARVLAECETMPTWGALRDALLDRSAIVREAAEQSLTRISQSLCRKGEESPEKVV